MYDAIGVFGYPKSGNTWIQTIFTLLGQVVDPDYIQDDIHLSAANSTPLHLHPSIKLNSSTPCVMFKSHEYYKNKGFLHDNPLFGVQSIKKVILIKRNPLDMLISFINHICFMSYKCSLNNTTLPKGLLLYCTEELALPAIHTHEVFNNLKSLSDLMEYGLLELALESFSKNGLAIKPFKKMSSSWSNQILSWEAQNKVATLSLRYEDLIDFKSRELTRISSFVEVEQKQLERAYDRQNQASLSEKILSIENERASFYNEMGHGHFINYFDRKSLKNFFNQHSKVITNCGYEYILDT